MSDIKELANTMSARGTAVDQRVRDILKFVQDSHYPSRPIPREKRQAERHKFVASAWAQPLDKSFAPVGRPFQVVTSNLSKTGLCLYSQNSVDCPYLAVRLECAADGTVELTLKIYRRRPVKRYIQIAGVFVSRPSVES